MSFKFNGTNFIKKIQKMSKEADRIFEANPSRACEIFLEALWLADQCLVAQLSNKNNKDFMDATYELHLAFRLFESRMRNFHDPKAFDNDKLQLVYELVSDGQRVFDIKDNNLYLFIENYIDSIPKPSDSRKRLAYLRSKKSNLFLMYVFVYNQLREKIKQFEICFSDFTVSPFRFYDNMASLSSTLDLITLIKKHSIQENIRECLKRYYNKRKLSEDDLLFDHSSVKLKENDVYKIFKEKVFHASGFLGEEVLQLTQEKFEIWFNDVKSKKDVGEAVLFYGHSPQIAFNNLKTKKEEFNAAHEFGHAISHYFCNQSRSFGQHLANDFIEEIFSITFETLYIYYLFLAKQEKTKEQEESCFVSL